MHARNKKDACDPLNTPEVLPCTQPLKSVPQVLKQVVNLLLNLPWSIKSFTGLAHAAGIVRSLWKLWCCGGKNN